MTDTNRQPNSGTNGGHTKKTRLTFLSLTLSVCRPISLPLSPSHADCVNPSTRVGVMGKQSSVCPFPRPPLCAHLCRRPATLKLQHRSRADALALRGGELDAHRERGGHTRGKSTHGTDTRHDREVSLSLIHSTGGELSVALGGFVSVCPALSLSLSLRQVICVCVSACLSVSRPCVTDASTRDQHTLASRHHTPPSDRQTATATPHSDSFVQPASQSSLSVCLSVCHLSPPPTHRPTHSWQQTADKCQSKET